MPSTISLFALSQQTTVMMYDHNEIISSYTQPYVLN